MTVLGALLLAACSGGAEPIPAPSGTVVSGPVRLSLSGGFDGDVVLDEDPEEWTARDSDEALLRAWDRGELELPRVRFVAEDHVMILAWPDWEEHRDPNRVDVTFRIQDHLVAARDGQCTAAFDRRPGFVITGTIDCEDLKGVKPGVQDPPVFDVHAVVDYRVQACVTVTEEDDPSYCRPPEMP